MALSLAATACADAGPDEVRATSQPVIYGTDDRQDVYQHPDMMLRQLAARSIVAQVPAADLDVSDPTSVSARTVTLRMAQNLCEGERFADDPTVAACSGTLIDDNLVLTAGHCFMGATPAERQASCRTQRFVFGYYRDSATALHPVTIDDVFECDDLVAWQNGMEGTRNLDYAVVRLTRSASPRFTPVAVRRAAGPVTAAAPLAVIGFGSGIPAKIDSGGRVLDPRADSLDFFTADTDTFAGNSGSGVFDPATRELVGILVRGATDYVMRGDCNVANVCTAADPNSAPCAGESVNYPQPALTAVCAGSGSARLCGTPAGDAGVAAMTPPASGGCSAAYGGRSAGWGALASLAAAALLRRRRGASGASAVRKG